MPQAIAAVATWVAGITATTWITVATIVSTVASTLISLKAAKSSQASSSDQYHRQRIQRSPNAPHEWVYGKTIKSGVLVYYDETDSSGLAFGGNRGLCHLVIALAPHECQSIDKVFFNDKLSSTYPDTHFDIYTRLGAPGQTAIQELIDVSDRWTADHKLEGICYIYVKFRYDVEVFPGGIPNVKVEMLGKSDIKDPRTMIGNDPNTMTSGYTTNPSLCVMDFLTHPRGANADILELDIDSFNSAANICDEFVDTFGVLPQEKRFALNGIISTKSNISSNLKAMLTSMGGRLGNTLNGYSLIPGVYPGAPVINITNDDLTGPLKFKAGASRGELFNTIQGQFVDPESLYLPADFPSIKDDNFILEDNGEQNIQDIDLPFTNSAYTAQRLARLELSRNRNSLVVETTIKMMGLQLTIGQTCYMTIDDMGWTNQEFEVIDWRYDSKNGVSITLKETSLSVYSYVEGFNVLYSPSPIVASSSGQPAPLTSLSISDNFITSATGVVTPVVLVSWDAPEVAFITGYEVQWSEANLGEWQSLNTTETQASITNNIVEGLSIDVRVRVITVVSRSPWYTNTYEVGYKTSIIPSPTSLSAISYTLRVILNWDYDGALTPDLKLFEIWGSVTNDRSLASKVADANSASRVYKYAVGAVANQYFWIRAIDTSDNISAWFPSSSTAGVFGTPKAVKFYDLDEAPVPVSADNLIFNGQIQESSNINFSGFTYFDADEKTWVGEHVGTDSITAARFSDNSIPIDITQEYEMTTHIGADGAGSRVYSGLAYYNKYNELIQRQNCFFEADSVTNLFEAASAGATSIKIVPPINPYSLGSNHYVQLFAETDGSHLPSRVGEALGIDNIAGIDKTAGTYWTIPFKLGNTLPVAMTTEDKVALSSAGATYGYFVAANPIVPQNIMQKYTGRVSGVNAINTPPAIDEFRIGTAKARAMWLVNYGTPSTQRINNTTLKRLGDKLSGVADGATVGADWASNLASRPVELTDGRISGTIDSVGQLVSATTIDQGDGLVARRVSMGLDAINVLDGDIVDFSVLSNNWTVPPLVRFSGGLTYSNLLSSTVPHQQAFKALNLTVSGFTASLKLTELAQSPVLVTDSGSSNGVGSEPDKLIEKSTNDVAFNNTYTFRYNCFVKNLVIEEGIESNRGSLTVGFNTNDGTGWVLRSSSTHLGSFNGDSGKYYSGQTKSVIVSGLIENSGGKEFGLSIESSTYFGSTINFTNVKYTTDVPPAEVTATPSGATAVSAFLLGGE